MVSLFLLLGCNLSYIVDLIAALHEFASASARTLLKLASSVRALLKPYGDKKWLNTVFDTSVSFTFSSKTLDPLVAKNGSKQVNNTNFNFLIIKVTYVPLPWKTIK